MYRTQILINRDMALGDVIQIEPIIRAVHDKHQGHCDIDVTTRYPDVFKNNPYVRSAQQLASVDVSKYNKIINLDWAYELDPGIHVQDAYLNVAVGTSEEFDKGDVRIYSTQDDGVFVENYLKEKVKGKFIVLHMRRVGIIDGRNLSEDFWGDLIEGILDNTDLTIVQVGAGNDLSFDGDERLVNALGLFNVQQLKELIARAEVFLGSDSAPMHIAYTTDTPTLGLFTTVRAEYRSPRNRLAVFDPIVPAIDCYGCKEKLPAPNLDFKCTRGDYACLDRFDVAQITDKIKTYAKE